MQLLAGRLAAQPQVQLKMPYDALGDTAPAARGDLDRDAPRPIPGEVQATLLTHVHLDGDVAVMKSRATMGEQVLRPMSRLCKRYVQYNVVCEFVCIYVIILIFLFVFRRTRWLAFWLWTAFSWMDATFVLRMERQSIVLHS